MQRNFLIVAADGSVRNALAADLRKKGFNVTLAENGAEARRVAQTVSVNSVLVESHLPDMTAEQLRAEIVKVRPDCRVIVLTSFHLVRNTPELLKFGVADYLLGADQIFELVEAPLAGAEAQDSVQQQDCLIQVIDVLVGLLELEYKMFGSSSHQAMQLARAVAEDMGAVESMLQEVILGTLLRDIGRVGNEVSEHYEDLDPELCALVEQADDHVVSSMRLLEHIDFPWKVLPVIRHHHERYNGTGVPDGLRGREIPMGARIVAVVDAYVSMTTGEGDGSIRPDQALAELVRRAGHEFDPEVVESFHRVVDKRLAGRTAKGKPRVLLVESEGQFRRLLRMRLGNEGYEVEVADNYERGLERLLKDPPDVVMVDLDVDANEAFQLLQEMQQDERLCRIPAAFLSRSSDRVLRLRALRQGVDDFICKGDDMEELVARVENILLRQAIRTDGEVKRARRGITGSLENLGLPDIVQTLTIGMKTACVSLTCNGNQGRIWFENGTPSHAETDTQRSEEAFYAMVRWTTGEFVIEHGVKSKESTLNQDSMFLLMEGLRLMDEESEDKAVQAS